MTGMQRPFPNLNKTHEKSNAWTEKCTNAHFRHVLFTDEDRAKLDGPDGCSKVWSLLELLLHSIRHQQGVKMCSFKQVSIDDAILERAKLGTYG